MRVSGKGTRTGVAALAVLGAVWIGPAMGGGRVFVTGSGVGSDVVNQYLPYRQALWEGLRRGRLPLWTDRIGCGFPLLAEGQGGFFCPPSVVFGLMKPVPGFNWNIWFALTLAGGGMWLLARKAGLRGIPALAAACVFALSGFFVCRFQHLGMILVAAWLPTLVLVTISGRPGGRPYARTGGVLVPGLVVAVMTLTGHPQILLYALMGVAVLAALAGGVRGTGRFALAVGIGLALAAALLVPQVELARLSPRTDPAGAVERARFAAYQARDLLLWVRPYLFGDPSVGTYRFGFRESLFWENCAYIGLLPLGLAAWGVRGRWRLVVLIALGLLIAFGPVTWVYSALGRVVPGFAYLRLPQRALFLAAFGLAVLAGAGLGRVRRPWGAALLTIIVLDLARFGMGFNGTVNARDWLTPPETARYLRGVLGWNGRAHALAPGDTWELAYEAGGRGWRDAGWVIPFRALLGPNSNMLFGVPTSLSFTPLGPRWTSGLGVNYTLDPARNRATLEPASGGRLGAMAVSHVVSFWEIDAPGFRLEREFPAEGGLPPILVYRNLEARPRVSREGGEARITRSEDGKLEVETDSRSRGRLIVRDTEYPGWRAWVDGTAAEIRRVETAFRSVQVEPGTHRVRFRFQPGSFLAGVWISAAVLAAVILVARRDVIQCVA